MSFEWRLERQDLEQTKSIQICFDNYLFSVISMSESKPQMCLASWKSERRVEVGDVKLGATPACGSCIVMDCNEVGDEHCSDDCIVQVNLSPAEGGSFATEHFASSDCQQQRQFAMQPKTNLFPVASTRSSIPSRKSWLNDWKMVTSWYPSYKKRLQTYLQKRSQVQVDNNSRRELTIRTDSCWEYELKEENLQCTCQTIWDLLETRDHVIHGVIEGRTIRIKCTSKVAL